MKKASDFKKRKVTFELPESDSELDCKETQTDLIIKTKSRKKSIQLFEPPSLELDLKVKSILKKTDCPVYEDQTLSSSFLPLHIINAVINSKLGPSRAKEAYLDCSESEISSSSEDDLDGSDNLFQNSDNLDQESRNSSCHNSRQNSIDENFEKCIDFWFVNSDENEPSEKDNICHNSELITQSELDLINNLHNKNTNPDFILSIQDQISLETEYDKGEEVDIIQNIVKNNLSNKETKNSSLSVETSAENYSEDLSLSEDSNNISRSVEKSPENSSDNFSLSEESKHLSLSEETSADNDSEILRLSEDSRNNFISSVEKSPENYFEYSNQREDTKNSSLSIEKKPESYSENLRFSVENNAEKDIENFGLSLEKNQENYSNALFNHNFPGQEFGLGVDNYHESSSVNFESRDTSQDIWVNTKTKNKNKTRRKLEVSVSVNETVNCTDSEDPETSTVGNSDSQENSIVLSSSNKQKSEPIAVGEISELEHSYNDLFNTSDSLPSTTTKSFYVDEEFNPIKNLPPVIVQTREEKAENPIEPKKSSKTKRKSSLQPSENSISDDKENLHHSLHEKELSLKSKEQIRKNSITLQTSGNRPNSNISTSESSSPALGLPDLSTEVSPSTLQQSTGQRISPYPVENFTDQNNNQGSNHRKETKKRHKSSEKKRVFTAIRLPDDAENNPSPSPTKRIQKPYRKKSRQPFKLIMENIEALNCAGEPETLSPHKRDDIREKDLLIWIYNMIDEPARVDYEFFLKDGCILCKLMNRIKPGCIPEEEITWEGARSKQKNIHNFLAQAEKYGVPKAKLFYPEDLLHLRHIPRVTRCIYALAKIAQDDPGVENCAQLGDEPNFAQPEKKVFIPGHRDTKEVQNQITAAMQKKEEKTSGTSKHSLYK